MEVTLDAVTREGFGKNEARRLRRQGSIPAVLYGGAAAEGNRPQATPIAVDPKALLKILHSESGANTLIALKLGSTAVRVLIREYQLEPITHALLHADFYRIAMDRMLTFTVPIVIKGEAPGVKQQGGILDFVHREIEIECLPGDIPENIEVDVSDLMVGQSVRVRDLPRSVRWKAITEEDVMLVHVILPKAEEPEPAPETVAAVPAEPEVIKKGKVEKPEEAE